MALADILLLLAAGAFAGLIGGLFGIGGGVVIVPALYYVFGAMEVPEAVRMKLAVGTSLATIIVTSARSLLAHNRTGRVEWTVLKAWAPFIGIGAVGGAMLARAISADLLTAVFAFGVVAVAIQRGFGGRRKRRAAGHLPAMPVQWALGAGTGLVSSLMGIGGGVIGVVLLTGFGRPVHVAIATAAGFGLAIAVPGAIGFVVAGLGTEAVPGSVGYVHFAGFASVAAATVITAPFGARLAHRLPDGLLNRIFAAYLALTGILLLREVFA